ncbi:DNA polymerase III, subunit gamma and tau [Psittacicella hinzii]|uniref:DNA polymerase III subunit gamma/tau n=1 Tax=Psittacicella hinzii TaxID=2028575 RepID=A0A3A1Y876_9GAMM|nr:DNA polymerase III subunit gamma/tau [Psittacicella hinzii]RIY33741.1 DNA polymerase III, subunit gamma and tau [Psittacicella hinzii]
MTANYTVLARKYRPKTFSQVVGQEHVLDAMKNSILNNKLHSVYLLSGTRGVGKTTIARIFTKAMNCENFSENKEPCDRCASCKSIDDYASPDLLEVDAASRTKVEETRELIESIQFPPLVSKYKVFIIDEVHMLTVSSFNALLKTLEEPPEYAKFILCTTDPQKIPATVLSRCLHFHLKPFSEEQIAKQLKFILNAEEIKFENKAVQTLALAANGSMRDCLSLTDQAIAIGNQEVTTSGVYQMLGLVDDTLPTDLVIGILRGQKLEVLKILQDINSEQADWQSVIQQILNIIYQASIITFIPVNEYEENAIDNEQLIAEFQKGNFDLFNVEKTQIIYEVFSHALEILKNSSNPYQVMQLACIRALAFGIAQGAPTLLKFSQTVKSNFKEHKIDNKSFKPKSFSPYKKINSTIDDQSEFSITKNKQKFSQNLDGDVSFDIIKKKLSGMYIYNEDNDAVKEDKDFAAVPEEIKATLNLIQYKSKAVQEKVNQETVEVTTESLATSSLEENQEPVFINSKTELLSPEVLHELSKAELDEQEESLEVSTMSQASNVDHLTMSSDEIAAAQKAVDLSVEVEPAKLALLPQEDLSSVNILNAYRSKNDFLELGSKWLDTLYQSEDSIDYLFAYCMKEDSLLEKLAPNNLVYLSPQLTYSETINKIKENNTLTSILSLELSKGLLLFITSIACAYNESQGSSNVFILDFKGNKEIEDLFNRDHKEKFLEALRSKGIEFSTIINENVNTSSIKSVISEYIEQSIAYVFDQLNHELEIFK